MKNLLFLISLALLLACNDCKASGLFPPAGAGTAGGATEAKQDTGNTSLGVMDDWDESDRAKVNTIVGQAGVAAGAGASSVTTQRVVLASDSPNVPISYTSSASKTRPADTNAYTAGDTLSESTSAGTVWTFASIGPSAGNIMITGVSLRVDIAAVPSGMSGFRLHLYDTSPTAVNDNAAFDLPSGDRVKYLGYIDIPTPSDLGATLWAQDDGVRKQIRLAAATTSIFGILEIRGAYTPTSGSVNVIELQAVKLAD